MSVEHHKKLTTTIVPLAPRKEIRECQHTIIIFLILVTVWSALRLYARRVRHAPMNIEDALFYTSVVRCLSNSSSPIPIPVSKSRGFDIIDGFRLN